MQLARKLRGPVLVIDYPLSAGAGGWRPQVEETMLALRWLAGWSGLVPGPAEAWAGDVCRPTLPGSCTPPAGHPPSVATLAPSLEELLQQSGGGG